MVPIASTLKELDDATDRLMLIDANEVNSERLPTTECVAPESINASPSSRVDTTPIPTTLGRWCLALVLASFAFALIGQLGDQWTTSPQ
ncbi:hypothetical protein O181_081923 [Austropuccinia psidii MF-1]|uniref:Uncharacterized protein n=1 Tax=Austropuccinia psidii MF-1 TaxID=1389203 RepID=A0A9Q3FLI2_9BASI|nr:hypothetical protein [Austropuccinia psidii MF-1]